MCFLGFQAPFSGSTAGWHGGPAFYHAPCLQEDRQSGNLEVMRGVPIEVQARGGWAWTDVWLRRRLLILGGGVCRDNQNKRQYCRQTLYARVSVCTSMHVCLCAQSMSKKESETKCLHEILKIVPLL